MRGPQGSNVSSSTCSRCNHQFPDLNGVPPDFADYIAQIHVLLCPGSSDQEFHQAMQQFAASGTGGTSVPIVAGPSQPSQTAIAPAPRTRRKYETDVMERKATLEADKWAARVTETGVVCKGCKKMIKLDKRNQYYPGLWIKHRGKCKGIMGLQSMLDFPNELNEKPASRSVDRIMGMGDATSVGGENSSTTVEGGTRRMSHDRAFSPYVRSSTRSRSSSRGSSVAGPSAYGNQYEDTYSLHGESATPPPEQREFAYSTRPVTRSPPPRASFEDPGPARYNRDEEPSTSSGNSTPRLQESHEDSHIGSDQYWSEAPFDGGLGDLGTGTYRCSTRWELMHEFPKMQERGYKYDDSNPDEEMSPASP